MTNPFLTVHGPRPERWWAVCNLCGQTSAPRFESADAAGGWEHDCHTEADDDGTVTLTVEYTIDDPPKIRWTGNLAPSRLQEVKNAFADMVSWTAGAFWRDLHPDWRDMVAAEWAKRRQRKIDAAIASMTEIVEHPYVCPGCRRRRFKTARGLRTHMRTCRRVDQARLKAGDYDHQMVPGGAPS